MPPRKLDRTMSLLELRKEIVWSLVACTEDEYARQFAPMFTGLLGEWQAVFLRSLELDDAEVAVDYRAERVDDRCDGHVDDFSVAGLQVAEQDRGDAHYRLYFTDRPSRIKRPVLGPQIETLRSWVTLLADEDEPRLMPFHAIFEADVADADAVTQEKSAVVEAKRRSREVGDIARFFDKVEQVRDTASAQLEQHRAENPERLPRDYASRFFLKTPRRELSEDERRAQAEEKAKARVELEAQLKKKRELLATIRAARQELSKLKR